jgi:enoyl-CoA hydratase/carnithine racemase
MDQLPDRLTAQSPAQSPEQRSPAHGPGSGADAADGIVPARNGAVQQFGFCRPERRNAITTRMYAVLADGLRAAAVDPAIKVVVLHGTPQVFTAGNDLGDFLNSPPAGEDAPVLRFLAAISSFPKPLVGAVTGPAVGVGTTMLLHCDLVYAGEDAQFSLPFASLGLCPEAGSSVLLPALAGYARAAEKLLFGEPFDAREARDMGLVNQVMPAAQVLEFALARAHALARQPVAALLETKRLLRAPLAEQVTRAMADENATFRRMITEPAAREAFSAFLEKRKADFSKLDIGRTGAA